MNNQPTDNNIETLVKELGIKVIKLTPREQKETNWDLRLSFYASSEKVAQAKKAKWEELERLFGETLSREELDERIEREVFHDISQL